MTTYSKETATVILELGKRDNPDNPDNPEDYMEFRPDGLWTTEKVSAYVRRNKEQSWIEWTPACDLDGPNAPDPQTTPSLPFPFTANQLAAFMLDGVGWFTVDALGGWDEGPNPSVMEELPIWGTKAREAVEGAYQAYRDAETEVGRFDGNAHAHVQRLEADYKNARSDFAKEHGVGEAGVAEAKRDERIKWEYAAIADKLASLKVAGMAADTAWGAWRKAMVRQLLQSQADTEPAPKVAASAAPVASASKIEGAVPPPGAPVVEVPAPEPRPAATWTLTKRKRFQGYTEPLYLLLEAAHIAGQPQPTAREVLRAFAKEQPSQIAKVIEGESLDYYLANSAKTKTANLKAISEVIAAMTGKSQNSPA